MLVSKLQEIILTSIPFLPCFLYLAKPELINNTLGYTYFISLITFVILSSVYFALKGNIRIEEAIESKDHYTVKTFGKNYRTNFLALAIFLILILIFFLPVFSKNIEVVTLGLCGGIFWIMYEFFIWSVFKTKIASKNAEYKIKPFSARSFSTEIWVLLKLGGTVILGIIILASLTIYLGEFWKIF